MSSSDFKLIIKPGEGINALTFGATMVEAEKYFGKPSTIEKIDDIEEFRSIVWHYWELGFSLFFDDNSQNFLSCIEVDNRNAILWDTNLFMLNEAEILRFFKQKGFTPTDMETQQWGEKRISFDELLIDLYFEKDNLLTINCSTTITNEPLYIYPN